MTWGFLEPQTKKIQKIPTDGAGQQNVSDFVWKSCIKEVVMNHALAVAAFDVIWKGTFSEAALSEWEMR